MNFEPGQILLHQALPECGRGRVEAITSDRVTLLFERSGGGELKIFTLPNDGLALSPDQSPEGFPVAKAPKGKTAKRSGSATKKARRSPNAWSFEEAWKRFSAKYAAGFNDPNYSKDERDYKLAAVERWNEKFGPEGLAKLRGLGTPEAVGEAFDRVYQGLNLLHPIEWVKFRAQLKGSPAGMRLVEEYAAAVKEGAISENRFNALLKISDEIGLGAGKWTLLTLWPYLAAFKGFPFIKPTVTQACADGLGFAINYEAKPNYLTYQRVVALYEELWQRLEPLGARDWVDLQSFVWVGWR